MVTPPPPPPPPAPPQPVDLAQESVAGEEDPGAGVDAPLDETARQTHDDKPPPADDTRAG